MKCACLLVLLLCVGVSCSPIYKSSSKLLPWWMKGNFSDDYGINYTINDTLFTLQPSANYHIFQWNAGEQFLLAKNDENNHSSKSLYTRIDYMPFTGMASCKWGFCLTVYNAPDAATALKAAPGNRAIPKKGCNGFPFSRIKKVE